MSKQTHYPSPWEFEEEPNGQDFVIIHHEGTEICSVRGTDDMSCIEEEEVEDIRLQCIANAKLIAAAPDLLKCLQDAVELIDFLGGNMTQPKPLAMIEAIKKATE